MNDVAVKVTNLTKSFLLPHEKRNSLKSVFLKPFQKTEKEKQIAFKNVDFEIKKGEFFGIVGRNGSGKSTLLKCIAGVYTPDSGSVKVNGSLVPFIELGVGFNPELSGRDNVFLNGALLGFSRKEMEDMYSDIVDFAELEKFMDQKLKNYSSGMQVRLAFSIAIRAKGDVLLLDEVLAVGDSAFQQKCYDYFNELKKENRTIVLVSHNMQAVERFCDRALLLEKGQVQEMGGSSEIGALYEEMFIREEVAKINKTTDKRSMSDVAISSVRLTQNGEYKKELDAAEDYTVSVTLKTKRDFEKINLGINIKNHDNNVIIFTSTEPQLESIKLVKNVAKTVSFRIQNVLTNGVYRINIGVADNSGLASKTLLRQENALAFSVNGAKINPRSLTNPSIKVSEE